jgi:hypothetical protein
MELLSALTPKSKPAHDESVRLIQQTSAGKGLATAVNQYERACRAWPFLATIASERSKVT